MNNSKIVLFIQMQLCDTTLHDWLRYRDRILIEEISTEKNKNFHVLNELGRSQCWDIFQQLLTAVEVNSIKRFFFEKSFFFHSVLVSSFSIICSSRYQTSKYISCLQS